MIENYRKRQIVLFFEMDTQIDFNFKKTLMLIVWFKKDLNINKLIRFMLWIIEDQQTGRLNKPINIYQKKYVDNLKKGYGM